MYLYHKGTKRLHKQRSPYMAEDIPLCSNRALGKAVIPVETPPVDSIYCGGCFKQYRAPSMNGIRVASYKDGL